MSPPTQKNSPLKLLMVVFIIMTATSIPVEGLSVHRKLDDDTGGVKCGSCSPCNNPCTPNYSPPPPPRPALPPPPPPPKKPPTPSGPNCPPPPPPPSSGFIYITGPPGNLYPIDPYFSAGKRSFAVGGLPLIIGCGLVAGLLAFW